jgi:hypothetical protein
MPITYVGMPFVVSGRFVDPDNFPNPILSYVWGIKSVPPPDPDADSTTLSANFTLGELPNSGATLPEIDVPCDVADASVFTTGEVIFIEPVGHVSIMAKTGNTLTVRNLGYLENEEPGAVALSGNKVIASPMVIFRDSVSITPTVEVDTPGDYVISLAVFDGAATTIGEYHFNTDPAWATSAYLSGACNKETGIGVITDPLVLASGIAPQTSVYANATSIVSKDDANTKAMDAAANALGAVLDCCPGTMELIIPSDAPTGSVYQLWTVPENSNPQEDYAGGSGLRSLTAVMVNVIEHPSGMLVDFTDAISQILISNTATRFSLTITEPAPVGPDEEPTDFDLTMEPPPVNGNMAGIEITKRMKVAPIYPSTHERLLRYEIWVPSPATSRYILRVDKRLPPLPVWAINGAGWNRVKVGLGVGETINALGLFLLTGGSLSSPNKEARIAIFDPSNSDLNLMESWYDLNGFSRIPYRGSLYGYDDRRAIAPIPRTGFVSTAISSIRSWAQILVDYLNAHAISAPISFYFRGGYWDGVKYKWYADSFPLNLEWSQSDVSLGSLSASSVGPSVSGGVITLATLDHDTTAFFATVRNTPTVFFDLFRWDTLGPEGAVTVGVYLLTPWPNPTQWERLMELKPGAPAGRGYDVTNVVTNPGVFKSISAGTTALGFYFEDVSKKAIAPFPMAVKGLTNYSGSVYEITSSTQVIPGLPPGLPETYHVLVVDATGYGTKIILSNVNS